MLGIELGQLLIKGLPAVWQLADVVSVPATQQQQQIFVFCFTTKSLSSRFLRSICVGKLLGCGPSSSECTCSRAARADHHFWFFWLKSLFCIFPALQN